MSEAKIFRICFTNRGPLTEYWSESARKLKDHAEILSCEDYDFRTRSEVLKTRLDSKLWYGGTAFQPTRQAASQCQNTLYRFFGNNKPERVARHELQRPREGGEWSIPDMELFCVAIGLRMTFRVLEDTDHVASAYTYFLSTEVAHFGENWTAQGLGLQVTHTSTRS